MSMFAALPWGNQLAKQTGPALPQLPTGITQRGIYLPTTGWIPNLASLSNIVSWMFYISLTLFILFLILVFIHFTMMPVFSFSPNDPGFLPIPTVSDEQTAFTKNPATSDLPAKFKDIPECSYTVAADVYLSGNFFSSSIPRVLLYRSINDSVSPPPTDTSDNLVTRFPDTNILVWLDSMKNDLYVSVITSTDGTASTARLETSQAVQNIPVKNVFRVTVVFTQQFVEIYINGKLEQTMAIKTQPVTVAPTAEFYPVIQSIGPNVLISNLSFWPRVLTSREVAAYGSPISNNAFFSKST
jgi:hypothetical protein